MNDIQFSDKQTDRQTDQLQVHVLSCAFSAKNWYYATYYYFKSSCLPFHLVLSIVYITFILFDPNKKDLKLRYIIKVANERMRLLHAASKFIKNKKILDQLWAGQWTRIDCSMVQVWCVIILVFTVLASTVRILAHFFNPTLLHSLWGVYHRIVDVEWSVIISKSQTAHSQSSLSKCQGTKSSPSCSSLPSLSPLMSPQPPPVQWLMLTIFRDPLVVFLNF